MSNSSAIDSLDRANKTLLRKRDHRLSIKHLNTFIAG